MQCASVVHGQAKYAFITSHRLQETVAVYPERTDAMIAASSGGTGRRRKALTLPPSVFPSGTRPAPPSRPRRRQCAAPGQQAPAVGADAPPIGASAREPGRARALRPGLARGPLKMLEAAREIGPASHSSAARNSACTYGLMRRENSFTCCVTGSIWRQPSRSPATTTDTPLPRYRTPDRTLATTRERRGPQSGARGTSRTRRARRALQLPTKG